MTKNFFRWLVAAALLLGIAFLAGGEVAWADRGDAAAAAAPEGEVESAVLPANPGPGSVKPPPGKFGTCENGLFPVGGVVVLEITDLKPGYCVEAELWNPRFQFKRYPEGAGSPLADLLFVRIYYQGKLVYDLPLGDGTVEACYAVPPEKQVQFYFYDFYGMRFQKRTEPPMAWDLLETRVDEDNRTACAFTRVSGAYSLTGQ